MPRRTGDGTSVHTGICQGASTGTHVGPNLGRFAPGHVYRSSDGGGTWQIGQFAYNTSGNDTPGSTNTPATGACCNGSSCTPGLTKSACETGGGTWLGPGTNCAAPNPCTGACCAPGGGCTVTTRTNCINLGRWFRGGGTTCAMVDCTCDKVVKINEIWAGDPVTDDVEFIELYHPPCGSGPKSLSGLSLIVIDGDTGGNTNSRSYKRVTLRNDFKPGDLIDQNGFFLLASDSLVINDLRGSTPPVKRFRLPALENDSQTYVLTPTQNLTYCSDPANPTVPPAGCQNDVDANRLTDASIAAIQANAVDSVATTDTDAGDHVYAGAPVVKNGIFQATQMQRTADGQDTDAPADWEVQWNHEIGDAGSTDSPGESNSPGIGACCVGAGCVASQTQAQCAALTGEYQGNGSVCAPVDPCIGACCLNGSCLGVMTPAQCATAGGAYMGDGIACVSGLCTLRSIAQAEALPPRTPVVINSLVVISEDDVIGHPDRKTFQVRRADPGMTISGRNAEIDPLLAQFDVGDTIALAGTTGEYHGLFELTGKVAPLQLVSFSDTSQSIIVITLTAADFQDGAANAEVSESRVVRLNCMTFLDGGTGTFKGDRAYLATDGSLYVTVWIPASSTGVNGLVGTTIPVGARDIRGILWQADFSPPESGPLTKGYRLNMRNATDILGTVTCGAALGACCAPSGTCSCGRTTQGGCIAAGGDYSGDGSLCSPNPCTNRLVGDIDDNGIVNFADAQFLVRVLLGLSTPAAHVARADLNCDGKADGKDIQFMAAALNP